MTTDRVAKIAEIVNKDLADKVKERKTKKETPPNSRGPPAAQAESCARNHC